MTKDRAATLLVILVILACVALLWMAGSQDLHETRQGIL